MRLLCTSFVDQPPASLPNSSSQCEGCRSLWMPVDELTSLEVSPQIAVVT